MGYESSRRNFLKGTGVVAAAAAFGGSGSNTFSFITEAKADEIDSTSVLRNACGQCGTWQCRTKVTMKNGVAVHTEGDLDYPKLSKGRGCSRNQAQLMSLYNPYRMKAPMKRTNPKKGINEDPGWVEITWNEALDTVAGKWKEAAEKDPRTMIFQTGFADRDNFFQQQPNKYFPEIFKGSQWIEGNGSLCTIHTGPQLFYGSVWMNAIDLTYCEYALCFGLHLGPNFGTANDPNPEYFKALDRGMKIVHVDPRATAESSHGEWVPIKPGTDFAAFLAILYTMMHEIEIYDEYFLKHRSNSVYLIGDDKRYLRNEEGKPLIWDLKDNKAKAFDDPTLDDGALDGEYIIDGKKARPSFVLIRESVKENTPEWAEKICEIPAARLREIAHDVIKHAHIGETITVEGITMPYRPVSVMTSRGICCHANGAKADLASCLISGLVGAVDVPGAPQGMLRHYMGGITSPTKDGTVHPDFEFKVENADDEWSWPPEKFDLSGFYPHKHSMNQQAYKSIANPKKYNMEIEAATLYSLGANPIISASDTDDIIEGMSKIPFIATVGYHYDEQAWFSDILLPQHQHMEEEVIQWYSYQICTMMDTSLRDEYYEYRDPVPPVHNTMHSGDITLQIFYRMGKEWQHKILSHINKVGLDWHRVNGKLDIDKQYTAHEILNIATKEAVGKTTDELAKGPHHLGKQPIQNYYNYCGFPGKGETRYQMYFHTLLESRDKLFPRLKEHNVDMGWSWEIMEKAYSGTCEWYDIPIYNPKPGYDLLATNQKIPLSMSRFGSQDNTPWMNDWGDKYVHDYGRALLNTKVAKEKGIKEGDLIKVENQDGDFIEVSVHVTELVHPASLMIGGCFGRKINTLGEEPMKRAHFNMLYRTGPGLVDPVDGAVEIAVPVKITKV
ncbi:MAG: anaerobic selenocysteine-containing dehydrogenase [Sulfurimonas sp.]|jgi:anaerobic selenocysteine-containing dehydrogenase